MVNKSPQNICISFIKVLSIMKVFSLVVYDSTQHNRKPIITTKVFTQKHSPFSLNFVTGLTLRTETNDDHCKRQKNIRFRPPGLLHEEKLSRLPGLPCLPSWDNSSTRVVSPPLTTRGRSSKRLLNFTTTQGEVNWPKVTWGVRVKVSKETVVLRRWG